MLDGIIHLSNVGGTQNFSAGQFGFTPSFQQPPVMLPTNPGMHFAPPLAANIAGTTPSPICKGTQTRSGTLRSAQAPTFAQGDVVMIQAGGYAPATTVSAYLGSNRTAAGSFTTDSHGQVSVWIRVPASTPAGTSTVQVNGELASKTLASITSGVYLRPAQKHVVQSLIPMDATQGKLSVKERAALTKVLVQIPATVPSQCQITSTDANARAIKKFFASQKLVCQIKKSANASNANVKVQFSN